MKEIKYFLFLTTNQPTNQPTNSVPAGLFLSITGDNNYIEISDSTVFQNCNINIKASNTVIKIGKNSNLSGLYIEMCCGNGQQLILGDGIRTHGVSVFLNEDNASLIVHDNCLFSGHITIWPTDGHAIYDKDTKQRINNLNGAVEIGEHCWVGYGVKMSKNAKLPKNTVVGIASVVTKAFSEENTIIAGNPAKVVKRNILWHTNLYHKFD